MPKPTLSVVHAQKTKCRNERRKQTGRAKTEKPRVSQRAALQCGESQEFSLMNSPIFGAMSSRQRRPEKMP
jgi:hypothetical protein